MIFLAGIENQSLPVKSVVCLSMIGALGVVDYFTGYELSFSLFYVLPIALATWTIGRPAGLAAAIVSACVWFWADLASGHPYSHPLIPVWNTLIRFSFFVIITLLLLRLREALAHERSLARTDDLTGAVNSRYFHELAEMEIERLRRFDHPFTLAYLDLDHFKILNDKYGHATGDEALRTVASLARRTLRKTDIVARLGGDEFALLLPETGLDSAQVTLAKLQEDLLAAMQQRKWPVTFSIGVLTCAVAPASTDKLVKQADELMYEVKRKGKNAIHYATLAA